MHNNQSSDSSRQINTEAVMGLTGSGEQIKFPSGPHPLLDINTSKKINTAVPWNQESLAKQITGKTPMKSRSQLPHDLKGVITYHPRLGLPFHKGNISSGCAIFPRRSDGWTCFSTSIALSALGPSAPFYKYWRKMCLFNFFQLKLCRCECSSCHCGKEGGANSWTCAYLHVCLFLFCFSFRENGGKALITKEFDKWFGQIYG